MTEPTTHSPPPGYLPLPAATLPDMLNTPGWKDTGFGALGLIFEPGASAVMVAGVDAPAAVWWMLDKAEACCHARTGFSATPAGGHHYVRGIGCDLALIRHTPQHRPNPLANEALRIIGEHFGVDYYRFPIKGTMCLYMPYLNSDMDNAHVMAPELIAAVVKADVALARAAEQTETEGAPDE